MKEKPKQITALDEIVSCLSDMKGSVYKSVSSRSNRITYHYFMGYGGLEEPIQNAIRKITKEKGDRLDLLCDMSENTFHFLTVSCYGGNVGLGYSHLDLSSLLDLVKINRAALPGRYLRLIEQFEKTAKLDNISKVKYRS